MASTETVDDVIDLEEALVQSDTPGEVESKREQSTISFPYHDLTDAITVAKGIHAFGGTCENAQLAAQLQSTVTSGGFRLRLLAAKIFGLITYKEGRNTLTRLGEQICDSKQEKAASAEAFLNVTLYRQVYERFKNGALPPNQGLEAAIAAMGVIEKQAGKARQVLQRSASQAGFFWSGQDRLVMPPINGRADQAARAEKNPPPDGEKPKGGGDGGGGNTLHPLIAGLIKTLPADENWPIERRVKWLRAAAQNFDLIYQDSGDDFIEIKIQRGTAQ